jgi:hypothetical protein
MWVHLQVDTRIGDTLQGMVRQHVLATQGSGKAVRSLAVGAQGTDTRERRQPTRQARQPHQAPRPRCLQPQHVCRCPSSFVAARDT